MYMAMGIAGLSGAATLFIFSAGRFRRDGMLLWTLGFAAQGLGWALAGLRGAIPDFPAVVVANTLLVFSFSLLYAGVREFQGRPYRRDVLLAPTIVAFAHMFFHTVVVDRMFCRASFLALVCGLQVGAIAWALIHDAPIQERRSQWLMGFSFLVGAMLWLSRLWQLLTVPHQDAFIHGRSVMMDVGLGLGLGIVIITGMGFLLMKRERDERALREDEERFRQMADSAFEGIVIHDGGVIQDLNQSILKLIGYTYDEVIGTDIMCYIAPESRELATRNMRLAYDKPLEMTILRKDGGKLTVEVRGKPIVYRGKGVRVVALHDVTERKRMEEAIRDMSLRDPLTDLYNRRGFITLGERQLKAADRARRPLLLAFIDLDDLKLINDRLGHDEGDRALICTADILRKTFRESDIIARIGGDEFAVLAIDTADLNAEILSKRLQRDIDELNGSESRPYRLAVSHGAVTYQPGSQIPLEQLISAADGLMYEQKKAKSNR